MSSPPLSPSPPTPSAVSTAASDSTVAPTALTDCNAVAASGNFNIIATDCLREGGWLNDEVMNFYFELLRARSERVSAEQKTRQKCFFFNTFFYAQLANTNAGYCYQNVERWTRRLMSPLFSHDVVFVPIHVRDSHWCLAVMRLRDKKIEYWDSLRGRDEGCLRNLLRYLADEAKGNSPHSSFNPAEWTLEVVKDAPLQTNCTDCGVFTCKLADCLCMGIVPTFDQADMPGFRRGMLQEIQSQFRRLI